MPLGPQWYRKLRNEIRRGSRGAQPNFADVLTGTLYYVTDETVLERSSGAAWEPYSSTGEYRYVDSTATGTQNNWNLSVAYNTVVEWHGASDITVTGITGGLLGRFFIFRNTGTKIAYFSHNSGSSSAGNKLLNIVTAGDTPVAPGGYIGFVYFQTGSGNWNLIAHDQGPLIDIPYSSGNFTADAGTWTVDSGDIDLLAYKIEGRTKYVAWRLNTTSNSSAAATTAQDTQHHIRYYN